MNMLVVAYKFGTEQEIGEHLGTYHYFIEKMRRLSRMGHEVTVLCPYISFFKKGSRDFDGIKIVRYWPLLFSKPKYFPISRFLQWLYIFKTQREVLRLASFHKYDFLYVWQARETGYAACKAKNKISIPVYFRQITAWKWHFEKTPRDMFGKRKWYQLAESFGLRLFLDWFLEIILDRKNQMRYAKYIYKNADKIIFLSQAAIEEGKELGLNEKKAYALAVGIEENLFQPIHGKESIRKDLGIQGKKVALFIGRIHFSEKGVGVLLDAVKHVASAEPDFQLVIVGGGGESERMFEYIEKLGIQKYVFAAGRKPFSELVKYINASDALVVPSLWMEAFGQVTIEGMACGVPVVTSDAGASPEINIHGITGFVVPKGDAALLARAILKIFQDENFARSLGEAGRKRVQENYSYAALINKFLQIVRV